jgi:hypothetical protein
MPSSEAGGPFEAPHDLEERSSAIWSQEELTISSGLCSVDVARAERFIENIKHWSSQSRPTIGQAKGSMTHGGRNWLTSTSVLRTVSDLILSGTRRMTSKPIAPLCREPLNDNFLPDYARSSAYFCGLQAGVACVRRRASVCSRLG